MKMQITLVGSNAI